MLVRMLCSMAGSERVYDPGVEYVMDEAEGLRLVDAGFAELVEPMTAMLEAPENAMKKKGAARAKRPGDAPDV